MNTELRGFFLSPGLSSEALSPPVCSPCGSGQEGDGHEALILGCRIKIKRRMAVGLTQTQRQSEDCVKLWRSLSGGETMPMFLLPFSTPCLFSSLCPEGVRRGKAE